MPEVTVFQSSMSFSSNWKTVKAKMLVIYSSPWGVVTRHSCVNKASCLNKASCEKEIPPFGIHFFGPAKIINLLYTVCGLFYIS